MKTILILGLVFVLIDAIYLNLVSPYFNTVVRRVQGSPIQLDWIATILCYILLVGGLYWFVIRERRSWKEAAFLGLVVYGVYETTTKALLKNWDWFTVLLDTTWGMVLFSISTIITYKLT